MRMRIVQCLCGPSRHAIMAMAHQDETIPDDHLEQSLRWVVGEAVHGRSASLGLPRMNPWCGICGSVAAKWVYEVGWSREFRDMAEAEQMMRRSEVDQGTAAALLDFLDLTYDSRLRTKH